MDEVRELSKVFDIFSNEVRLCILINLYKSEEKKVGDIINCSNSSQSFVSQQLSKLKDLGIIDSRRSGNEIYYKLIDPKIIDLISKLDIIEKEKCNE